MWAAERMGGRREGERERMRDEECVCACAPAVQPVCAVSGRTRRLLVAPMRRRGEAPASQI